MGDPFDERVPERTEQLVVTVGMIWREARVSCPHRDLLRAYRDGALAAGPSDFIRWHLEQAQCPYCQAQIEDLDRQEGEARGRQLLGIRDRLRSSTITLLRERRAAGDRPAGEARQKKRASPRRGG